MKTHESVTSLPTGSESKEGQRGLGALNVLVHPFFITHPFSISEQYQVKLQTMFDAALARFTPLMVDQLTTIMPDFKSFDGFLLQRRVLANAKSFKPNQITWIDLYNALRTKSPVPHNTILVPNIISESDGIDDFNNRLGRRGLLLTSGTLITVGGECLNNCVAIMVDKIMRLPQVACLRVDKEASIPMRYGFDYWGEEGLILEDYEVTEDERYYYVKKEKSADTDES